MNFQILAQIILAFSFFGLAAIIFKKIPLLAELEVVDSSFKGRIFGLKEKLRKSNPLKDYKPEIFLQKILSKVRILSLKADNKASDLIQILHKRVQKKNNFFYIFSEKEKAGTEKPVVAVKEAKKDDNYWQEIKTSVSLKTKKRSSSKKTKKK